MLGFTRVPPGTYCCSVALLVATGDSILGICFIFKRISVGASTTCVLLKRNRTTAFLN